MLLIRNFKKAYPGNDVPVLTIDELSLDKGIYWLKGENGSGKTSLLKSAAGLAPFEGSISVNGIDINKNRVAYMAMVNHADAEPRFPPFLSGKELIDFYRATKRGDFPTDLAGELGVDEFMQQKTMTYSSGMTKKLSLVLAFTGKPALILLDEALVALDVAAVATLHRFIHQYYKNGVSFMLTSHQPLKGELADHATNFLIEHHLIQPLIK